MNDMQLQQQREPLSLKERVVGNRRVMLTLCCLIRLQLLIKIVCKEALVLTTQIFLPLRLNNQSLSDPNNNRSRSLSLICSTNNCKQLRFRDKDYNKDHKDRPIMDNNIILNPSKRHNRTAVLRQLLSQTNHKRCNPRLLSTQIWYSK